MEIMIYRTCLIKRKAITVIRLFAILYYDEAFQHVFFNGLFSSKKIKDVFYIFIRTLQKKKKTCTSKLFFFFFYRQTTIILLIWRLNRKGRCCVPGRDDSFILTTKKEVGHWNVSSIKWPKKEISKISIWNVVCGRIIPQSPSLSVPCWLICTQPGRYVSNSEAKIGLTRCSSYLPFFIFNVAIYLDIHVLAHFSKTCAWQEELNKIPFKWKTTSNLQPGSLSSFVWFCSVQHLE